MSKPLADWPPRPQSWPDIMTEVEVCQFLRLDEGRTPVKATHCLRYIRRTQALASIGRLGGRVRFQRATVEQWLAGREQQDRVGPAGRGDPPSPAGGDCGGSNRPPTVETGTAPAGRARGRFATLRSRINRIRFGVYEPACQPESAEPKQPDAVAATVRPRRRRRPTGMIRKVAILRRWRGRVPRGRNGEPIPRKLWPQRRECVFLVRWFARDTTGKIVRPSRRFATREEAEQFRTELQAKFDKMPEARRVPRKVTLGEFIGEFLTLKIGATGQRLKPRSVDQLRHSLKRFATFMGDDTRLASIAPADAARYLAWLRDRGGRGSGPGAVNMQMRCLRSALSVAIRPLGYIDRNPFKGIQQDRVTKPPIRYVTGQEFGALLAAADETDQNLWWRGFLSVCYTAGLRYSEAVHLTWADVDFAAEAIHVAPKDDTPKTIAWTPKDYKHRVIPVPPVTMRLFADLHADATEGHAYVFVSPERIAFIKAAQAAGIWSESRFVLNNFQRDFPKLIRRAATKAVSLITSEGVPTMSLHDLRRTAITNWSRTANVQTVAKLAGHSDIATTMRYYAAVTEDQIAKVRAAGVAAMEAATRAAAVLPSTDEAA